MFLAQANVALFRWPLDDVRMATFASQIRPINELAEQSDGFVWRYSEPYMPRDIGPPWDSPLLFFNMSVWRDRDSLLAFVQSSQHRTIMSERTEWIVPVPGPSSAEWWIDEAARPTVDEAIDAIAGSAR